MGCWRSAIYQEYLLRALSLLINLHLNLHTLLNLHIILNLHPDLLLNRLLFHEDFIVTVGVPYSHPCTDEVTILL